jgi:hypothetical protein
MMNFYQLSSKSPSPETPDRAWFTEAQKTLLCKGCNAPRVATAGIDATIQGVPDRSALNFVPGICVGVAEVRFLRALLPEGPAEFLRLGKVFDSKRRESPDVVTFMGHKTVVIRGGLKSGFRVCPECGRISYSPIGKRYVLKRDVGAVSVLDAWFGTLVVTDELAQRVIGGKWKNLVVQKLEVRDEPVDGLDIPV